MSLIQKLEVALVEQSCAKATSECYCWWARKFYGFTQRPASQWTGQDVRAFLFDLARANYSAVSRKQALNALAFVFRHVLKVDMGHLDLPPMPQVRQTLRTVPTREELGRIFAGLRGQARLMAGVMYGSGPRISECCHLRVQNIDLAELKVNIWDGKGGKCRRTVLPVMLVPALRRHIAWVQSVHDLDLSHGGGLVELPGRLAQKYRNANRELRWQWLWPSAVVRGQYRWHATPEMLSKQMRAAVKAAGIIKRITPHTLRHAFATHAMQSGNDIQTVKDWLGHEDLNTTAIYLHKRDGVSPLDAVAAAPIQPLAMLEEWG